MYEVRFYRDEIENSNKKSFLVVYKETDIWVCVNKEKYTKELEEFTFREVKQLRTELEKYILKDPLYQTTFSPYTIGEQSPTIAKRMSEVASIANVGPMAAVAGAFSEFIGKAIEKRFGLDEIIVENGGDIYVNSREDIIISIFAGYSPLSNKIKVLIKKDKLPLGICTSSGTVGHSFSYGKADAVVVICKDTALADSLATALCNKVKKEHDIELVLEESKKITEILGCLIILKDKIGMQGCITLVN